MITALFNLCKDKRQHYFFIVTAMTFERFIIQKMTSYTNHLSLLLCASYVIENNNKSSRDQHRDTFVIIP